MLNTRFQMVGTHPVIYSYSNGRHTSYYTIFFENWDSRLHAIFHMVELLPVTYTLVFKLSAYTQLRTRFQMVGTHPDTHSFSNGQDT